MRLSSQPPPLRAASSPLDLLLIEAVSAIPTDRARLLEAAHIARLSGYDDFIPDAESSYPIPASYRHMEGELIFNAAMGGEAATALCENVSLVLRLKVLLDDLWRQDAGESPMSVPLAQIMAALGYERNKNAFRGRDRKTVLLALRALGEIRCRATFYPRPGAPRYAIDSRFYEIRLPGPGRKSCITFEPGEAFRPGHPYHRWRKGQEALLPRELLSLPGGEVGRWLVPLGLFFALRIEMNAGRVFRIATADLEERLGMVRAHPDDPQKRTRRRRLAMARLDAVEGLPMIAEDGENLILDLREELARAA